MAKKHRDQKPRPKVQIPPYKRLTATYYSEEECELALQGRQIPQGLGRKVTQACVVRGIRRHPGFATELHGTLPIFTRALNARRIISDSIPDMTEPEEFPYCIWYPDVAKESIYRELAARYPQMKYHVGRACAVAGYTTLYRELDLLPEVHIAEEARDNGSHEILGDIMAHRQKFSVMDDYTLSVHTDLTLLPPSFLNGDTVVRSFLDTKREFTSNNYRHRIDWHHCRFDIVEDSYVDTTEYVPSSVRAARSLAVKYLYTPLPVDLPPLEKDLLILVAAYNGDIDRYSRLRRPGEFDWDEHSCVIRGIYHNTFFAKWWAVEIENHREKTIRLSGIMKAVTARAIMNNDLSRITSFTPDKHIPYCIWYPSVPAEDTLELLVARRPDMAPQVARACIVANYEELYDKLNPRTDFGLLEEAKASPNRHYIEALKSKIEFAADHGVAIDLEAGIYQEWKRYTRAHAFEPTTDHLRAEVGPGTLEESLNIIFKFLNTCDPLDECENFANLRDP